MVNTTINNNTNTRALGIATLQSTPKSFNGKGEDLDNFLQDVVLYLDINDDLYNNDEKKIAYTLSFINLL